MASDPWETFGVRPELISTWQALGLSAFEAALAEGDGFAPDFAEGHRSQLQDEAAAWAQAGLDTLEGLQWHRAGFSAAEASEWLHKGLGPVEARREAGPPDESHQRQAGA